MAKVRVPIWGKPQGHATVNTEATKGAVVGENLYNADGTLYEPPAATPTAGTTKTLWSLLANVPAIVTSLVNLSTNGWIRKDASVLTARALAATDSSYDNTTSGLSATDVQAAVDEVAASGGGGGYAEGAAFPGSPATNDKFYRTDLNLLCFYDGARWLTVQEYTLSGWSFSQSAAIAIFTPLRQDFALYLTRMSSATFVNGTNDGSNYWTIALSYRNSANADTSIVTFNTSGDSGLAWADHDQVVNAPLSATARALRTGTAKTGAPSDIIPTLVVFYRLIVT